VERAGHPARHPRIPDAGAHLPVEGDDLAVPGEQERQGVISHLPDPQVGDIDDDDPQVRRGGDVDDVIADPAAHDDLEALEGLHHAPGDGRRRDDEGVGVAGARDHLRRVADEW
jgi:hypothetical protein